MKSCAFGLESVADCVHWWHPKECWKLADKGRRGVRRITDGTKMHLLQRLRGRERKLADRNVPSFLSFYYCVFVSGISSGLPSLVVLEIEDGEGGGGGETKAKVVAVEVAVGVGVVETNSAQE